MQLHSARGILGAIGFFCLAVSTSAQTPPPPRPLSPAALAAEPYVLKSVSTVATMNADGTGTRLQTFLIAVQSDAAARQFSVVSLYFPSQSEHADFTRVHVTHADGTTQDTPVTDAIEQPAPVTREAPLYSDIQTKQLPVKSLRAGDILEWQARFTVYHPESPGQFWGLDTFYTAAVTLDETYELHVPTGLHVTAWANPRAGGDFAESDVAGQHIYRWHHANLKPTVGPEAEAAKKAEEKRLLTPDEELDAVKGKLPDFAYTTFPDWAAVGSWYRSLATDRATPDAAIRAKVAELTAGKTTDLEKAQALYSFVSSHIRYVGVDFGIGRYQPHTAAEVFANAYGDCKDKHTLLAAMLSVAGIHADPVLIGAGVRFNSAAPSPQSFNHVITHLTLDGKDVFLDATAEVGIWGALMKGIRDQDALVVPASAPATIAHTPAELPFAQTNTFAVDGTLDTSLTSESKITLTLHDDSEVVLRALLRNVSPAQYGEFVQGMMSGMGFGGTTSDPEIAHLDDPSKPLALTFHYHRVKEKDWGDNRITAAFELIQLPSFTTDDPPTSTIQLGSPRTEDSTVQLKLPEGWIAELPAPVHAHAAFATCDITYSLLKDHVLTAERRLVVLQSKVPIKDAKRYQTWYDDCGAGSVPYIQLAPTPKVSGSQPAPKAPDVPAGSAAKPSDPKAADLVQQAIQSINSADLDTARKLLDQAAAINPTEKGLWLFYARIAALLGINTQALEDSERELTYHPDQVVLYPYVERVQTANHDTKAALATAQAWVKAAPQSLDAALAVVYRLLDNKSPDEALKAANNALDRLKSGTDDLTNLQIAVADAQTALGQSTEAANTVVPLLKTTSDPVQINNIAYMLAKSSTHLAEANTAEAKVLEILEAETASWTVSDDPRQEMGKSGALVADWDTMAWILFHQGKFSEALGYANAAIHGIDNKEVRDHLTAINAVLHNVAATATLHADGQQLRTYPLGPAKGRKGTAAYTLLIANGKVVDSKEDPSGSKSALTDAQPLLRTVDLHALFPPNSKAQLLRFGFINCHSDVCELILNP